MYDLGSLIKTFFRNMSSENLVYLSSEQALTDLAEFIVNIQPKYDIPSNAKWVVFGGSYPGSLAAWARLKYPHLIHAAVSSSGPLLAKLDFKGVFEYWFKIVVTYYDLLIVTYTSLIEKYFFYPRTIVFEMIIKSMLSNIPRHLM